jgi:hypothetical protein
MRKVYRKRGIYFKCLVAVVIKTQEAEKWVKKVPLLWIKPHPEERFV